MKRNVRFGLFAPQVGATYSAIKERVLLADRLGYDSYLVVDHFWSRGMIDLDHLEAWTLMAATAAITERIKIGTLVMCNSYRNPALLAKMASSLDHVSNGRFILGIGAGWMDEEYRAYGFPFPGIRVRIEQLEEALVIIKRMWLEPQATFQGKYYAIEESVNNPKPVQKPHPPILIGGAGEKRMLRVIAEHANIWNCPNNVAHELQHKLDVLKKHCDDVGRDPDEIEVSEQCVMVLGADEKELQTKLAFARATVGRVFDLDKTGLIGTPDQLIERIQARNRQGVTYFTTLFGDLHSPETLQLFAEKVMPAFR